MSASMPIIYDSKGNPVSLNRLRKKAGSQATSLLTGFKGANDENLADWAYLPLDINDLLSTDLYKLRARSRDLARNDDTAKRFLALLKQNVLGHAGIKLQAKNKLAGGKKVDKKWNEEIEREWQLFCRKRRYRGQSQSPSACGQMTMREISWLMLLSRAVDGECFIQILRGYKHNRHRFALRFLSPDLLDHTYSKTPKTGNRVVMGIELDEFDRPVNYHFSESTDYAGRKKRKPIPADQIIHIYRREFVGQVRGIPDFTAIMHKAKMLNGVHEAIVVGWRVAAAKMGFFTATDPDLMFGDDNGETPEAFSAREIEATPGSFDVIPRGFDLKTFDPDYPTSTYESGNKVFMQQLSNGLNVSSPTLSNNYEGVNYSSLRQALLEDREGWRCVQAEIIDDFEQPIFDEWYGYSVDITGTVKPPKAKRHLEPTIAWQPRGWPWVDPLKEVKAQTTAISTHLRTRQSVISETSGADFLETADALSEENEILKERGLNVNVISDEVTETSTETNTDNKDDE